MKNDYEHRKALYFKKQRLIGWLMIIISALIVFSVGGESIVILFITLPIGAGFILSKKPVWTGDYYWKIKSRGDKKS